MNETAVGGDLGYLLTWLWRVSSGDASWFEVCTEEAAVLADYIERLESALLMLVNSCEDTASCGCAIAECTCGYEDSIAAAHEALCAVHESKGEPCES